MIREILCRATSLAGTSALVLLSCTASAGEWQITPRIEVRESYTDNVFLTARNRKSDFFTTVSPGIGITGEGARLKLSLDYALNYDAYLREDSLNGIRHDLRGSGTAELLQNSLFVDFGAFAGQSPGSARGQTSAVDRRLAGNSTQFYSYNVSPYWRTRIGSWATTEARYRFSQIFSRGNSSNTSSNAVNSGNTLSDSNVHQLSGFVASGEDFNRLRWRLGAQHTETSRGGSNNNSNVATINGSSTTFKQDTLDFQPSYVVNRWLSLLGTIGYEKTESGNLSRDVSGEFWNAGFRLTPSERTSFELTYGKRYNGDNWSSSFITATDSGASLSFSYREAIENQALQSANSLSFLTRDANGALIDRRTGLPFNGRDPNFDQNDSTFLSRSFVLALRIPRERNSYFATAQRTIRDSNVNGISAGSGRSDTTTGGTIGWEHKLTPVASSVATLSYTDTKTDSGTSTRAGGGNKSLSAQVNLNYELNESLRASLGYAYIKRDVTGPQFFSNDFVGAYTENVVFVTLRKTF